MKNRLSRTLPGKRKLLTAAVVAAFATPATAWGQSACIHLAMQVQCPINPGTGLALPGGSSSLAFVPGGTNWQIFAGGIVFIPMTTFLPFVAPGVPGVGTSVAPGAAPTTGAGQLALVAPIAPRVGTTNQLGDKILLRAYYADQITPTIASQINPVDEHYVYSYFDDRNGDLFASPGELIQSTIPENDLSTYLTDGIFPVPTVAMLDGSHFRSLGSTDSDFKFGFSYRSTPGVSATFWDVGGYVVPGFGIPENGLLVAPPKQEMFSAPTVDIITRDQGLRFEPQTSAPKTHEAVLGLTQQLGRDASIGVQLNIRHHMQPEPEKPGPQSGTFATTQPIRTFVLPHVLEKSGKIGGTAFTFDTTLFTSYAPGMNSIRNDHPKVDVFLFDRATGPIGSAGAKPVDGAAGGGASARKVSLRIDNLIQTGSGVPGKAVILGFGVLAVGGTSADGVNLQGFVVNSHSSAFDLAVFGFDPAPLLAAGSASSSTAKRPIELIVPPDITQSLLVTQVKTAPGPVQPSSKPEDTPEIQAQQDAARRIVRDLTSPDPNKRKVAQEAMKVANFQTRRLVTGLLAGARLGVAQAQSDASNYAATNSLKTGP